MKSPIIDFPHFYGVQKKGKPKKLEQYLYL